MEVKEYISLKHLNKEKDLKKLENGEGCIFYKDDILSAFYHNDSAMNYLAYIEFGSDKARGNHFHKEKEENICVIKGTLNASYWLPNKPQEIYNIQLRQGDVVNIKAGCAHSYIAQDFAVAVEFSPTRFKLNDTYKTEMPIKK